MKEYIVIIAVFAVLLFTTPVVFGMLREPDSGIAETSRVPDYNFPKHISLLLTESGEKVELTVEEYLIGCLFAQIPVTYHEQALKAQAVAAHTYLLRLMLDGTVISDDAATCQPYFTQEKIRERYGNDEKFGEYSEKVKLAAEFAANRAIFYGGEPIYAVYHSVSAGVTNTAYSVWGRDFPYLRSVDSSWDREHPNFYSVNEMTHESIRLAIFDYNRTASMPVDYSLWFADPLQNEFGYVISVKAGETLLSGGDIWRIFDLRSTAFSISFREGGIFVIETRGFGHGAGLSQYGADVLARRGFSCDDILEYYYSDVIILNL